MADEENEPKPEDVKPDPEEAQEGGADEAPQQPPPQSEVAAEALAQGEEAKAEPEEGESSSQSLSEEEVAAFQDLVESGEELDPRKINFLYDVMLNVNIELGRAQLKIRDVLKLGPGSVVELNRLAGDPVEIIINNKLVAKGEVIVIEENFAVRITDIMSPKDIISTVGSIY